VLNADNALIISNPMSNSLPLVLQNTTIVLRAARVTLITSWHTAVPFAAPPLACLMAWQIKVSQKIPFFCCWSTRPSLRVHRQRVLEHGSGEPR